MLGGVYHDKLLQGIIKNIKNTIISNLINTGLPGPPTSLASLLMQGGPITQVLRMFFAIMSAIKIMMMQPRGPCRLQIIHADHDRDDNDDPIIVNILMMMKPMNRSCRAADDDDDEDNYYIVHTHIITYPDQTRSGRGTSWRWSFNSSSKTFSPVRL